MSKKIILILVLVALGATAWSLPTWANNTREGQSDRPKTNINMECLATAVNTREQTLVKSLNGYTIAITAAYNSRGTDLKNAYLKQDLQEIKEAVKAAWEKFNKSFRAAKKTWKNEQNTAWQTFKKNAVSCRVPSSIVDAHKDKDDHEVSGD